MTRPPSLIYTWTDEAPYLATHAFLPVIRGFSGAAGVSVETRDISLSGRVLAVFRDALGAEKTVADDLAELARLVESREANVIKLPNISASIPQLKECIAELRQHGYPLPDYPDEPVSDEEHEVKARYDSVKGSAVNPVLRQGNSDRRAPKAVKEFARANPPRMRAWPEDSASHVSTMSSGDFFHNELSLTLASDTTARIEHVGKDGTVTILRDNLELLKGEVLDATFMSRGALVDFLRDELEDAKQKNVLFLFQ